MLDTKTFLTDKVKKASGIRMQETLLPRRSLNLRAPSKSSGLEIQEDG